MCPDNWCYGRGAIPNGLHPVYVTQVRGSAPQQKLDMNTFVSRRDGSNHIAVQIVKPNGLKRPKNAKKYVRYAAERP